MERENVSALALLELSAAFNMVDHEILLSVLEKKFGIRDVALKWFREYLHGLENTYNQDSSKCM